MPLLLLILFGINATCAAHFSSSRRDSVFFVFIILRCAFFYFPLSFAACLFLCAASGSQWQYFQFAKWRIQPTEMPHIVLITYSRVLVAEQSMAEQRYERSDSSHDMRYVCHAEETTAGILIILMRVLSYECMLGSLRFGLVWSRLVFVATGTSTRYVQGIDSIRYDNRYFPQDSAVICGFH